MIKRFMILVVAVVMVVSLSVVAYATSYNYYFTITPPLLGCAQYSNAREADGGLEPWVHQNGYSTPTTYFLHHYPSGNLASEAVLDVSTPGTRQITYFAGYGGAGTKYKLVAGASCSPFEQYSISGTWSPD